MAGPRVIDPYPLAPPGSYGATGPAPVRVVAAPPVDRGAGWYYSHLAPIDVGYFHVAFSRAAPPLVAGAAIDLVQAGSAPFTVPTSIVYIVTDWLFHAWRNDPSGAAVPLTRNDLVGLVHFRFLVDGSPVRFEIITTDDKAVTTRANFPYLETRPGPGLQSPWAAVQVPVRAGQTVAALADVIAVPPGFSVSFLGFEFSGIKMTDMAYARALGGQV